MVSESRKTKVLLDNILDNLSLRRRIESESNNVEINYLANLVKKAQGLAIHMEKNHKDLHNKRNMQVIEARIHKLSRFYKREGKVDKKWKYEAKIASVT